MGNVWTKNSEDDVQSKEAVPLRSSDVDRIPAMSSREDLKHFVASEITKAGTAIEAGFDLFLESREQKTIELEKINRRLEKDNNNLRQHYDSVARQANELVRKYQSLMEYCEELEEERRNNDHLTQEVRRLKDVNRDLDQELQKAYEAIKKLKELTDPTREMRRKGQSVRPGDVTHEEVALDFKNLYIQRDLLKQLGMNKQEQRSPFLTQLFKCAYDVCKASVIEIAKAELDKLFIPPEYLYNEDERANSDIYLPWKARQEALSLLLSLNEDKKRSLPLCITSKVEEEMRAQVSIDGEMEEVTAKVTELAWSMVTLSPPITFDERLQTISEDTHESSNPYGVSDDDVKQGKYTIKYRRPVLYFGSLGTIGEKGSIVLIPITEASELPLTESPTNSFTLDKGSSNPSCAASSMHAQALNTSMETTSCSSSSDNHVENVKETKDNITLKMIGGHKDTENMENGSDEIEKASDNHNKIDHNEHCEEYDSENHKTKAGNKKNPTDYDKDNVEASLETCEPKKTQHQLDDTQKEVMDDTLPSEDLTEKKKKKRKRKKKTETTSEEVPTQEVNSADQEASSDGHDTDRSLD